MATFSFTRLVLPAITFAFAVSVAPLAAAQSTMAPATAAPSSMAAPAKTSKLSTTAEFKTLAAATAHCPGYTVVWSSLGKTKSYHLASSKLYGKTKHGAYVCASDAKAAGLHASKI